MVAALLPDMFDNTNVIPYHTDHEDPLCTRVASDHHLNIHISSTYRHSYENKDYVAATPLICSKLYEAKIKIKIEDT